MTEKELKEIEERIRQLKKCAGYAREQASWHEVHYPPSDGELLVTQDTPQLVSEVRRLLEREAELKAGVEELERENRGMRKAIRQACVRFFGEGSDGEVANEMRLILEGQGRNGEMQAYTGGPGWRPPIRGRENYRAGGSEASDEGSE